MQIHDPNDQVAAKVSDTGALSVEIDDANPVEVNIQTGTEVGVSDLVQAANEAGNRAFVVSDHTTAGADEEVLYIQNEDAQDLIIERIIICTVVAGVVTAALCAGTAAGTNITPVAGTQGVALARSLEAKGNAEVTGLTPGVAFLTVNQNANEVEVYDLGLRLQQNEDICLSFSATGRIIVTAILRWSA